MQLSPVDEQQFNKKTDGAPANATSPTSRAHGPPRRSPSLEKYRRIEKPRPPTPDDEIRVMGNGRVAKYVTYATKLLQEQDKPGLKIRATGKAVSVGVSVCELIKRRFRGLHQVTEIDWMSIVDEYEPLEPGLPLRSEKRTVPSITIFLTRDESAVDKTAPGYQPPLNDTQLLQDQSDVSIQNTQADHMEPGNGRSIPSRGGRRNGGRRPNPRRTRETLPAYGEVRENGSRKSPDVATSQGAREPSLKYNDREDGSQRRPARRRGDRRRSGPKRYSEGASLPGQPSQQQPDTVLPAQLDPVTQQCS